jgi:hypothetical protein
MPARLQARVPAFRRKEDATNFCMHDGWEIAVRREPTLGRRRLTRRERMYVSLNKRGEIVMNGRAFSEIGPTANVTLMFRPPTDDHPVNHPVRRSGVHPSFPEGELDPATIQTGWEFDTSSRIRGTIAVKRPVGKDRHFFPVRHYGRGQRMHIVRAAKLLKQFGITIERTLVFEDVWVEVFDGEPALLLDLESTSEL